MSILVTGGAGFIGSHTCVELLNEGHEVIVVDNYSNGKEEALHRVQTITKQKIKIYKMNLQDKQMLTHVFSENNITAVIHFAGLKAVGESAVFPLSYYQNNMVATVTLCEVMKEFGVKKLVFSSSATVYGAAEQMPISEETPLKAMNPYGRTKLIIEDMLRDLYHSDPTWSITLLRYFNPIGAHVSGYIGEDPNGTPNNLLPYIAQVAVGKLPFLKIYGDDYLTRDGTGVRDYIHVVDLAEGHLKALTHVLSNQGIDAYNLGTGTGYSVFEVIKAFERASAMKIPYQIVARRPGDSGACYADPIKAKRELDFEAKRSIHDMCKDAWRWQVKYPNGYAALRSGTESQKYVTVKLT